MPLEKTLQGERKHCKERNTVWLSNKWCSIILEGDIRGGVEGEGRKEDA